MSEVFYLSHIFGGINVYFVAKGNLQFPSNIVLYFLQNNNQFRCFTPVYGNTLVFGSG